MGVDMLCRVMTQKGEFRGALVVERRAHPSSETSAGYVATVAKVFLAHTGRREEELARPPSGLQEYWGSTADDAERKACVEFCDWALEHGGDPDDEVVRW